MADLTTCISRSSMRKLRSPNQNTTLEKKKESFCEFKQMWRFKLPQWLCNYFPQKPRAWKNNTRLILQIHTAYRGEKNEDGDEGYIQRKQFPGQDLKIYERKKKRVDFFLGYKIINLQEKIQKDSS